jgi:hypothetical protein
LSAILLGENIRPITLRQIGANSIFLALNQVLPPKSGFDVYRKFENLSSIDASLGVAIRQYQPFTCIVIQSKPIQSISEIKIEKIHTEVIDLNLGNGFRSF